MIWDSLTHLETLQDSLRFFNIFSFQWSDSEGILQDYWRDAVIIINNINLTNAILFYGGFLMTPN